ncbi:MAG: oxygenase MpaB family protein [Ilumatobacteraceae bacterium]
MSREVLPIDVLDALRRIGDPELDHRYPGKMVPISWEPDFDKLAVAQRLFATYPLEISGALLLAALPQSYATGFGAGVLAAHGVLVDDLGGRVKKTAGFLLGITRPAKDRAEQEELWFPREPKSAIAGAPWQLCVVLRQLHAGIRAKMQAAREEDPRGAIAGLLDRDHDVAVDDEDVPLNQEDLLGMLLTLSITVFEVLEAYDLTWSVDEQEAYLHLWDVVGGYLGIGNAAVIDALPGAIADVERRRRGGDDAAAIPCPCGGHGRGQSPDGSGEAWATHIRTTWHGLRPPTIDDTRALLTQIRDRQWIDPSPDWIANDITRTSTRAGRILVRALLDTLSEAMPRSMERLPIALMRSLNPTVVGRRLNLGGNGFALRTLSLLPKRQHRTGRFTSVTSPNPISARVLRSLANEVTLRASLQFIDDPNFVFPAVGDWPA